MSTPLPWEEFSQDPRRPEAAGLRAGDRDRDVVLRVLADGYAEGRLTKEEYDERADATTASKTLGELPTLIADLVPQHPQAGGNGLVRATPAVLQQRAVQRWEAQRRQALSGFVIPSLICVVVWLATGFGFPWPLFVMLGTGMNVLRVLMHKQDIILEEERRLEKRQRKALEPPTQHRPPATE